MEVYTPNSSGNVGSNFIFNHTTLEETRCPVGQPNCSIFHITEGCSIANIKKKKIVIRHNKTGQSKTYVKSKKIEKKSMYMV